MSITAELGELAEAYQLYRDIVEVVPDEQTIRIDYRPEIVADNMKKFDEKRSSYKDQDAEEKAREEATCTTTSPQAQALLAKGFGGTIAPLFAQVASAEKSGDKAGLEKLKTGITLHQALPAKRRLGAKVLDETGYYWGGFFTESKKTRVRSTK